MRPSLTHERPRLAYYGEASAVLKGGWCDRGASQKCNVIEAHYFGLDAVRKDLRSIDFESLEERVLTSFCTSTEAVIELVESFHIEKQLSSDRKTTRTKLRISTPRSHSMQACESVHRTLCQMFDVMSGKALKPTEARIKTHGDQGPPWLTLELSRYFYEHSQANSSHFLHLSDSEICNALGALFSKGSGYLAAEIEKIFKIQFETPYLEDQIYWTVPLLEKQLERRFGGKDTRKFLKLKEQFFEFLEANAPVELNEFSRKHLRVVNSKRRGLKQLAKSAVSDFVSHGFIIPEEFGEDLSSVRGALMHKGETSSNKLKQMRDVARYSRFMSIAYLFNDLGVEFNRMKNVARFFGVEYTLET